MNTDLPVNWLPFGWTESYPGGIATNTNPTMGGIIDRNLVSKKWFVIPSDDVLPMMEGFDNRTDAFLAYAEQLIQNGR